MRLEQIKSYVSKLQLFQSKILKQDDVLAKEMVDFSSRIEEYTLDSISELSQLVQSIWNTQEKLKAIGIDIPPQEVSEKIHELMNWE